MTVPRMFRYAVRWGGALDAPVIRVAVRAPGMEQETLR